MAITLLLLVISSRNFHDVCQRFLYKKEQNFSWIQQNTKNFPINLHCKNRPLWERHVYRHDVTKVSDFTMRFYGEISHCLSDPTEIHFWLHKKRWHTSWKFQLELRSNKKVIAKKRLTNLYEMNSWLPRKIRCTR